jgi:serine/threonine protein phosphatase PrpC
MDTLSQISHWRVVAASVCGVSHIKTNQLCQDAHHWELLPDNILVAAVADGAGSASLGKVGAMVAVETAIEEISFHNLTQEVLQDDALIQEILTTVLVSAKKTVESEADACNVQARDFATTLILVIASPQAIAVAQIGDGVAVAKDTNGNLVALTLPDNGEYINQTIFLTSPEAIDKMQFKLWRLSVANVGILTDGLQMLALNMAVGAPHKPFFFPLFDFVTKAPDRNEAKEELVKFLSSEKITQRTDDDLTLILAAFHHHY